MSQTDALPTSADVDRCVKDFYDTPPDPATLLPSTYTSIIPAGNGTYGDVYFCLPSSAITATQNNPTAQTDVTAACTNLTKQLVAVKVCHGPSIPTLCNELAVLQIITMTNHAATTEVASRNGSTACNAFFEMQGHATCLSGDTHYFTTTTLPLVCTLDALKPHFSTLPEVFTWLIYTRIGTTLHWLSSTCDPGIAHGDVHLGNMLIGFVSLAPTECKHLPQIKLIDFGKSRIANAEPGYGYASGYNQTLREDKGRFLRVLAAMMDVSSFHRRSSSRSPKRSGTMDSREFGEFRTCVGRAVKRSSWDHDDSVCELEKRFGGVAERMMEGAKKGDKVKIWELVMNVTQDRRNGVQEKIEELITGGQE